MKTALTPDYEKELKLEEKKYFKDVLKWIGLAVLVSFVLTSFQLNINCCKSEFNENFKDIIIALIALMGVVIGAYFVALAVFARGLFEEFSHYQHKKEESLNEKDGFEKKKLKINEYWSFIISYSAFGLILPFTFILLLLIELFFQSEIKLFAEAYSNFILLFSITSSVAISYLTIDYAFGFLGNPEIAFD